MVPTPPPGHLAQVSLCQVAVDSPLSAMCALGGLARPHPDLSSSVLFAHRLRSPWVPSCLGQPRVLQGRLARSSPSLWDR